MAAQRVVDWGLAERVALAIAGDGPAWEGTGDELRAESERSAQLVRRYTGLKPKLRIPPAELIDRAEWARVNLSSFRDMSAEVEDAIATRLEESGKGSGFSRTLTGAATGAELGLAIGYLAQRVIGQYDVSLLGPAREPRLLFVGPNLAASRSRLGVGRELFLSWIALHETTHAVQFGAVPWLREHLGGIATDLFEDAMIEVKPAELLAKLARMNPRELIRTVAAGELATLLWTDEQRSQMDRLMSVMTVVEGYAEHVMDAVGDRLDPGYAELRTRLDHDRKNRGLLDSVISRLLGLEMKMAQYRRGKVFVDEIVRLAGIRAVNQVWDGPESMPTAEELDSPEEWLDRVGRPRENRLLALFRS